MSGRGGAGAGGDRREGGGWGGDRREGGGWGGDRRGPFGQRPPNTGVGAERGACSVDRRGGAGGGTYGGDRRGSAAEGAPRVSREQGRRGRSEVRGENNENQRFNGTEVVRRDHRGRESQGRGNTSNGTPEVRILGYKSLEELLQKDASVVVITLSSSRGLQALLMERTMRPDLVHLVLQVLLKALQARNERRMVLHLAQTVKDSIFFQNVLPFHVTGMMSDHVAARREQYPLQLLNIIKIMSDLLGMFPSSSVGTISMLVALVKPVVNLLRASGIDFTETIDEDLEKVQATVDHLQEKAREGSLRSDNYAISLGNEDTPPGVEDFRNMSIYPTPEEFHQDEKPFLRPNIMQQSYPNAHVYLDTHFRLMREDFVRPLREGIRDLLQKQQEEGLGGISIKKRRFDDIRVYFDTKLLVPICTHTGIVYRVTFDPQPLKFVRWENSKRLLYGSLVCLSKDNFESFLFATVANRDPKFLKDGLVELSFSAHSRAQLARVKASDSFTMVETSAYFEAYRYVLEGLQEQQEDELPFQRYIVECNPDVHPPEYIMQFRSSYDLSSIAAKDRKDKLKPFDPLNADAWPSEEQLGLDESQLKALKLALTKELAIVQGPPGTGKTYVGLKIARALLENSVVQIYNSPMLVVCYTNHALDQFLEGIHSFLDKGIVRVGGRSNSEMLKRFSLRELTRQPGFRRNLPLHIRNAFSEIQRELKSTERQIQLESARLVCSLQGVIDERFLRKYMSEEHWIRMTEQLMGEFSFGGKKSSVIMEWLGLGDYQQAINFGETDENERVEQVEEEEELLEMDEEAALIEADRILFEDLSDQNEWDHERRKEEEDIIAEISKSMLAVNLNEDVEEPLEYDGINQPNDGVWEMQRQQKKNMKQKIKKKLKEGPAMSEEEESRIRDIWRLNKTDKWRLYRLWVLRYQIELREKTLEAEQVYQDAAERLAEIRHREDLYVLQHAKVIGMTTTGAAKYRQVLQLLKPRLVIVEEAAEVLEAHTITTLTRDCQHLVLIGDHQQLRPSATVYELAKNFNLEVSMFERLINMNFPYVRLNYQHRMRPEIARLLTPHIYTELENHPSVLEYENIKGISTNMFFVDHQSLEVEIKDGKSHQNLHEAQFVVALCQYFLRQEYQPSQITILTTYTGQLYCLRKIMPSKEFAGVKVHVVDKYQGEENDIVILSLVRSNREGRVGFLQIPNRVCVALSRAKMGLYCIGNMEMFSKVKLWSNILHTLREKDQVGRELRLSCQNHPETQTQVSSSQDFLKVPEGGCNKPCEFRLDCGHVCVRMCHPYDADHKKYKCNKECPKVLCELGHKCQKRCYQVCGKCVVLVEKVVPQCQHTQKMPCHQDPKSFVCKVPCEKMLSCGHTCQAGCGDQCTDFCKEIVLVQLKCGHTQKDPCGIFKNLEDQPNCRTKCGKELKCGHVCTGTCHECYQGRLHKSCTKKCSRVLPCSHECNVPCPSTCPPCNHPCQNRCVHSKCEKKCGQPCVPCNEPCQWQCSHHSCSKLCHEPCDRPPCYEKCDQILKCGHPCIGLCGDPCPNKCRICHREEVTEIFFGPEDEPDATFIQLEDCKHIIETSAMDVIMGMDEDQGADLDQRAIRLKECPRCRTPIRRNVRYGTHVNRSLAEIEKVKEQINGQPSEIKLKQDELLQHLMASNNLRQQFITEFFKIREKLQGTGLSLVDLWHQENLIFFLEKLGKLKKSNTHSSDVFSQRFRECLNFLSHRYQRFTDQQMADVEREIKRLFHLADLDVRCKTANPLVLHKVHSEVTQARMILENSQPFSETDEIKVKRIFKELETKLPCTGLGISDDERVMIVKAMNLNKGHWYKCPNGHVYAIGDCGGAMENGRCPECNTRIGGAQHLLAQGNSVATEMDGAQHAAWSDTANLLNFDPMDLQNL
ncbi:NFX1-type zinc finger-containing protein 1 [Trichomycterus rosablanca]|uniref:NFX1-type zinc finger-containing protein 1 n=1 Tax=Trichomycterus rosablanca TaxID=2290929 RepID=UPI002F350DED